MDYFMVPFENSWKFISIFMASKVTRDNSLGRPGLGLPLESVWHPMQSQLINAPQGPLVVLQRRTPEKADLAI